MQRKSFSVYGIHEFRLSVEQIRFCSLRYITLDLQNEAFKRTFWVLLHFEVEKDSIFIVFNI